MDREMIEKRAREILAGLSLSEKIGQVTQIPFTGENIDEDIERLRRIKPGSLILCGSAFAGNEKQRSVYKEQINMLQKAAVELPAGIPLVFGRDVIHGHNVAFPVPLTLAASFDFDFARECYNAVREEAVNDGVNWTFSPMLDYCHESRWGRMVEGPGEDPYIGECLAKAAVLGFQTDDLSNEGAIAACAKHYIGYGASEGGKDYCPAEISDYSLQNNYLPAFRAAVDSGVATLMSSFNDFNGVPATGSKKLLTDILRGQLGFDGFVVSDWDAIMQMWKFSGFAEDRRDAAKIAIEAGVDMDMACNCYIDNIEDLIASGDLDEAVLDEAVLRILRVKLRMGLFENPYFESKAYDINKHLELSQRMAEKSIVLLKNKDNLLPLGKDAVVRLCGPFADDREELVGTWSLDWKPEYIHTVREAIKSAAPGVKILPTADTRAGKLMSLTPCDCAIAVIGEVKDTTGEAHSLSDISIPEEQRALLKNLKKSGCKVVGVMCFARPVAFGEDDELFDALLYAGHGGSRAAEAIAAILFGDAEPEGRLPFTLAYSQGQTPMYYNSLPGSRPVNGYYGEIDPWFCNYQDCPDGPNYPFGAGLAYTEFDYSPVMAEMNTVSLFEIENGGAVKVKLTVTNTGDRVGIAVPQLYVHDLKASRVRPLRVLRGFKKVRLEPKESREVEFELKKADLGFYLENGEFTVEKGEFDIYIGENCLTKNKMTVRID